MLMNFEGQDGFFFFWVCQKCLNVLSLQFLDCSDTYLSFWSVSIVCLCSSFGALTNDASKQGCCEDQVTGVQTLTRPRWPLHEYFTSVFEHLPYQPANKPVWMLEAWQWRIRLNWNDELLCTHSPSYLFIYRFFLHFISHSTQKDPWSLHTSVTCIIEVPHEIWINLCSALSLMGMACVVWRRVLNGSK